MRGRRLHWKRSAAAIGHPDRLPKAEARQCNLELGGWNRERIDVLGVHGGLHCWSSGLGAARPSCGLSAHLVFGNGPGLC